jgi:hypothetical protein
MDLLHHLGHAVYDFTMMEHDDSERLRDSIEEYRKSIIGLPHDYDIGLIKSYCKWGIGYYQRMKDSLDI